ncbi:Plasmid recombination enzyme [Ruminococcus sp. YE71]|uniref:plasmid recombination protein n=1 Tax=unclassified Ruminococcus TaxID=2608920 RepID=UPI000884A13A|nr:MULTISPECIES: plasmid recombination protein [unclassified Ruminococcus]SDA25020.1 Plasmid recombination enzyme [Ruminococcus sp. YE78]SFW43126.1 Plasmid recombination enzyme [Ruminococcus sp. YE71]
MSTKTISMCQGKGSLSHNNREFSAKNIDSSRTADNIVFVRQDLGETYDQLFGAAVERYNARQKRNDRKIDDYFQHLFNREPSKSVITGANKQKSFYEDLVQIGTKDDTGVGTPDAEIAVACLREYMEGFQQRNLNFHVFNAVMHLDEATPHLHIDYIPIGHFDRGLDTRNAMAKALEEMGHGKGANAINRWRLTEWEVLHQICLAHGIEIAEPKKSRGYSYTTEEYGKHKDEIKRLEEEKAQAITERDEARAELDKAAKKKVKLDEIEGIEAKESMFGKKVTLSKEDYDTLSDTAKKYVAMVKTNKKLKSEHDTAVQERDALKTQLTAVSSELAAYKKAEKEKALFTREKLNKEAKRISREDELSRELKKAKAFISACGLSADYQQFRYNSTTRKNTLE